MYLGSTAYFLLCALFHAGIALDKDIRISRRKERFASVHLKADTRHSDLMQTVFKRDVRQQ